MMTKLQGGPFDGREVVEEDCIFTVYRDSKAIHAIYKGGCFECYQDVESIPVNDPHPVAEETKSEPEVKKKDESEGESPDQTKEKDGGSLADFT